MEARYILELRDRDPATVEDLVLDGCESAEIEGISEKLVNLQSLSMVHVGLKSLKNLPKFPQLSKLDISDNNIAGGLEHVANSCPELLHLNLASNKIAKVEDLAPLKKLKLAELDLFNNPVTEGEESEYRLKVFETIPSLQILDGADINGEEVDDSLDGEDDIEGEDSGDESGSDIDGPGLSYLDNSQIDEDESEEYKPSDPDVSAEEGPKRGLKRRNDEVNGGESDVKKKTEE
ncbi:leucine Rich repeat-containing domain protein [Oesophagostomum dentatum]|uniref:Leucine Rich repeat-containing domain protein n=1 Tax=Oesophagostomum dentatum TaxID=61180 RepID=A0A0B1TC40_OESDE|nr:leucine Rich repeat-containing domain protein [Oesophagostomum dentatum]